MKAVILAGGFGTRISEESHLKPKPMIEIGDKPILWHIMKIYGSYGITDFIVCAGYKQHVIKEWFSNYALYNSDVTFDFRSNGMTVHNNESEPWTVTIADTGLNTMTGGRVKRIRRFLDESEPFCLTYGDGVTDAPIDKVVDFHRREGKKATILAVRPEGRFGTLDMDGNDIRSFRTTFEREPVESLVADGELNAYKHDGFWQCMDTMRDKEKLQRLWDSGEAPWKLW